MGHLLPLNSEPLQVDGRTLPRWLSPTNSFGRTHSESATQDEFGESFADAVRGVSTPGTPVLIQDPMLAAKH